MPNIGSGALHGGTVKTGYKSVGFIAPAGFVVTAVPNQDTLCPAKPHCGRARLSSSFIDCCHSLWRRFITCTMATSFLEAIKD
jgi:hypothetical protein